MQLLGKWELVQLTDGSAPESHQRRAMTFADDGTVTVDLWEHQLKYTYAVTPDPDHLRLVRISSTNPNDKPGEVFTLTLVIRGDEMSLNGNRYKRTALASGATLTPAQAAATRRP